MRALLSLGALLIVVLVVGKLAGTQLKTLAPAGSASAAGGSAAQQEADKLIQAMGQGAARRAADAASR